MADTKPIIIALDVETPDAARRLIEEIGDGADFYKVGMELYAVGGMAFVEELVSRGKRVFLDLKLYDIGETVKRATRQIVKAGVTFLTVHGSKALMRAAVEGRGDAATQLLAVTVLTSFDQQDLADLGYTTPLSEVVALLVNKAVASGVDGVVCSAVELANVRRIAGSKLKLVTPGVRSAGAPAGDQKRVATPAEAIRNGADYLVIGRQVTRASDPRAACEQIVQEIGEAAVAS
ncbi:MAG: orotidine-5'-phosphate decarboxylase [Bryobacteraceae bacterium]